MTDVSSTEQMLQDIAWLKSLATTLARDRDDADDLVQEARIAAWQRQPDTTRPMRGWLTKVVRDLAGMKRRSDRRRTVRNEVASDEQRGASSAQAAAPDELLAQMRLHKRLMELVLELDEPYRSTVIGRFVEGRTATSIAASLGIPAGTVRKRLHEALARLRAGLDADAGERTRWAPAVLTFANGGIHVAKPTKLVVVVVAALLLAIVATVAIVIPLRSGSGTTAPTSSESIASSSASGVTLATDARARTSTSEQRAAERAAKLAAITSAREVREAREARDHDEIASPSARPSTASDAGKPLGAAGTGATTLDITDRTGDTSDWQKRALGTMNNLLGQCYDLGRAEDPNLEGTVKVRFTLVGEPGVGGLLEQVEIVDADTTISQQTIRTCLTEQLYALELDPPPDGVTIERELSLKFP